MIANKGSGRYICLHSLLFNENILLFSYLLHPFCSRKRDFRKRRYFGPYGYKNVIWPIILPIYKIIQTPSNKHTKLKSIRNSNAYIRICKNMSIVLPEKGPIQLVTLLHPFTPSHSMVHNGYYVKQQPPIHTATFLLLILVLIPRSPAIRDQTRLPRRELVSTVAEIDSSQVKGDQGNSLSL